MQTTGFENWDFVDPKIVEKFHEIASFSQSLQDEQSSLQEKKFLTFKDKMRVQKNIDATKSNLKNIVDSQKSQLIEYFDKQLSHNSRRLNTSDGSKSFYYTSSRSRSANHFRSPTKSQSAKDLTTSFRRTVNKEKHIEEMQAFFGSQSPKQLLTDITPRSSNGTNDKLGRSVFLEDEDFIEQERKVIPRPLGDSMFFSSGNAGYDTDHTSMTRSRLTEKDDKDKQIERLKAELELKERDLAYYMKFHDHHTRLADKGRNKMLKSWTRKSKKPRPVYVKEKKDKKRIERFIVEKDDNDKQIIEELKNEKEDLIKGIKSISKMVIANQEVIAKMTQKKSEIEKELLKSKNYQAILLDNFSQFKCYVEKILADFAKKLKIFNEKEELYNMVVAENDELKNKCRDLIEKLKYISQHSGKKN